MKKPEHTHENMMNYLDKLIQKIVEDKEIEPEDKQKLIAGIEKSKKEFEKMYKEENNSDSEKSKNIIKHKDLDKKLTTLFSEFRENGQQEDLISELTHILQDGNISKEDLEALAIIFRTGDLKEIEQKRSGLSDACNKFIDKAQKVLSLLFEKTLEKYDDKGEEILNNILMKPHNINISIDAKIPFTTKRIKKTINKKFSVHADHTEEEIVKV